MKNIIYILLLCLCCQSYAQLRTSLHDASSMARGGGFVTDFSAGSVFDNPAGTTSTSGTRLLGNFTWFEIFPGVFGGGLAMVTPVKNWRLGVDLRGIGDIVFQSRSLGLSLSHAIGFTSLGAKANWIMLDIEGLGTVNRAGIDIGAISQIGEKVRLGVFASNINVPLLDLTFKEYLVMSMSFGINYTLSESANLNFDLHKVLDQEHQFSVGIAYQALKWATILVGAAGRPMSIHAGLVLMQGKRDLAYGIGFQNGLGNTHTWTLDYGF